MKKVIIGIVIAVVVLLIAVVMGVAFFLDSALKRGVETVGPMLTKTDVKLDGVSLSLFSGEGKIKGLLVGNPQGYKTPSAISVGSARLAVQPKSLFADKVVIKSINVQAPEVTFETDLKGNNLSKLLANIEAATGGGGTAKEGPPEAQKKAWVADRQGRRYEGGGTYRFWIARRMTLATATFQGNAYPVGYKYGRDMAFNPPLPAEVEMTATLYPGSDPAQARSVSVSADLHKRATRGGIFGAVQGMVQLTLDAPGEYCAHILARATDAEGHLWVSSMRHAGVVYPVPGTERATIEAHGKKLRVDGGWLERGDTNREGVHSDLYGASQLEHLGFPYHQGDVLLIASDGGGANKIEPVLSWAAKDNPAPYDANIQGIGLTNVAGRLKVLYGDSARMTVSSRDTEGTVVRLRLPILESAEPGDETRFEQVHRPRAPENTCPSVKLGEVERQFAVLVRIDPVGGRQGGKNRSLGIPRRGSDLFSHQIFDAVDPRVLPHPHAVGALVKKPGNDLHLRPLGPGHD